MNVVECKLLQCAIDSAQFWCLDNGMKLNTGKITVTSFTHKTNSINFNTLRTDDEFPRLGDLNVAH
jgi:hypothetical protein